MKKGISNYLIAIVSVAIPVVVVIIFYITPPSVQLGFDLKILPAINASLNFSTFCLLLLGRYFIKQKMETAHRNTMITAVCLSALFLLCYITYHTLSEPTLYGGSGLWRPVYFTILVSHILLAAAIVPMILITLSRGLQKRFDKHKRIAKLTWPVWLYVAATGVIVYIMLSPFYQ